MRAGLWKGPFPFLRRVRDVRVNFWAKVDLLAARDAVEERPLLAAARRGAIQERQREEEPLPRRAARLRLVDLRKLLLRLLLGKHLLHAAPRGSCAARGARADPLLSGGGGCARHLPRDLDRKVLLAHHPRERRHPVPALPQHHLPRRARPRGSARRAALAAGRGGADRVRLDFGGFVVGNLLEALHLPGARDGARALVLGAACARGGGRVAGARGPPLS